jgi:outer membrane protein assembly factor BamA
LRRLRGDAAYVVMMSATVIRQWFSARLLAVALGAAPLFGALVVDGLFAGGAFAQGAADGNGAVDQRFVVSDIRVEGLQRIAAGSVFAAMPIAVGDVADAAAIRATARSLFATGNFDDIRIGRDGNVLVVVVAERPSISEINIDGNKAIETEALLDGLKGAGLAVGQVFQRSTLEGMQLELQRQYVTQGRYDAAIETEVIPEPRNRVSPSTSMSTKAPWRAIKHVNVVGNSVFSDDELADVFELKTTGWFSFFTNDDKYSREKLTGDLEKLSSYYMDRGYLQFTIDSTQVSVSPDKERSTSPRTSRRVRNSRSAPSICRAISCSPRRTCGALSSWGRARRSRSSW